MKTTYLLGTIVAFGSLAAGLAVGCSSSSGGGSNATGTDGGGDAPSGSSSSGASSSSTSSSSGSSGGVSEAGTDAGGALSCAAYCTKVMATCTGANAQYINNTECMNACALFPVGAVSDTSGNTLGCRTYHTMLASTSPVPHCWHAGPYGYGACGDACANFCSLATQWCSPAGGFDAGAPPYANAGACTTACAGFAVVGGGDAGPGADIDGGYGSGGPASGNTLDCREYHLGASLQGGALQQLHCQHVGAVSPVCQ